MFQSKFEIFKRPRRSDASARDSELDVDVISFTVQLDGWQPKKMS